MIPTGLKVKAVRVKSIRKVKSPEYVCDLNIKDNHNLFVKSKISKKPVLAHNCLDENMKLLTSVSGKNYYSMANLAMQYGCGAFLDSEFGKENRATIYDTDLDKPLIEYCCLDVIVPMYMYKLQRRRAKDIGHTEYVKMVELQIGDMIHTFNTLETTGALADLEYLFKLKHPNSAINQEIKKLEDSFYALAEVQEANRLIAKNDHVPKAGLFGNVTVNKFDINKSEHKQILFFDVMDLKMVKQGKKTRPNGQLEGSVGKPFQEFHDAVPAVNLFNQYNKALKLRNAYVNSLIKLWGTDDDFKTDQRIRPTYNYIKVVTGRTSADSPNLQQVPSRSKLGKHIKRLFIAEQGKILIKVDYSAHEVRGWSIVSGDKGVADVFQQGADLRNRYKILPDPYIHHRIDIDGDVHKINASYFFGVPIDQVDKGTRDAVKAVIFGLIYQQGMKGLAKGTGRSVQDIEKIVAAFLDRFPEGVKWFDIVKAFAKEHLYVQSPIGRRRYLWPLLIPDSHPDSEKVHAAALRRAVNSPVQGFGSDMMMIGIRALDRFKFEHYQETGHYPDIDLCVSVHDSVTVEASYKDFWLAMKFIDKGLTTEVEDTVHSRAGVEFTSGLEIDFEIGPTERDVKEWNFSYQQMTDHLYDTLEFQVDELGYDIDIDAAMETMQKNSYADMPLWMQKQMWAQKIKLPGMDTDPRTKKDKKNCKSWKAEYPENQRKFAKIVAEKEKRKKADEVKKLRKASKSKKRA